MRASGRSNECALFSNILSFVGGVSHILSSHRAPPRKCEVGPVLHLHHPREALDAGPRCTCTRQCAPRQPTFVSGGRPDGRLHGRSHGLAVTWSVAQPVGRSIGQWVAWKANSAVGQSVGRTSCGPGASPVLACGHTLMSAARLYAVSEPLEECRMVARSVGVVASSCDVAM